MCKWHFLAHLYFIFLETGHKTQMSVVFRIPLFLVSLATFIVPLDNYLKAPTKKIAHFVLKVKLSNRKTISHTTGDRIPEVWALGDEIKYFASFIETL